MTYIKGLTHCMIFILNNKYTKTLLKKATTKQLSLTKVQQLL